MRSGEGGPDSGASNFTGSKEAHRIRRRAPLKRKCTTDNIMSTAESIKVGRSVECLVPSSPHHSHCDQILPFGMQSSPSQTFCPFAEDYVPPRSRTTAGSIWAPKQQETKPAWPPVLDGYACQGENSPVAANFQQNRLSILREDVFGPVGIVSSPSKKDVGAIGDGRKRQSPKFDDAVGFFIFFQRIYAVSDSIDSTSSSSCVL